jgi:hypothetical protein
MRGTSTKRLTTATVALLLSLPTMGSAAIVSGFDANVLPRNDDGSTGLVDLGFDANFFGVTFDQAYVNNNGNITFDEPLAEFTPFELTATGRQIIAPFFADVDTRNAGNPVTYGQGTFNGNEAFGVNWINVDYFFSSEEHENRNSFQLLLVERSEIEEGAFDIIFNYDSIEWETGEASGGNPEGRGGNSARAGFSNGTGDPGTSFELPGSGVNGAFLNGGPFALAENSFNSDVVGRYIFEARGGDIVVPPPPEPPPSEVPEPGPLALMALGMIGLAAAGTRRRSGSAA